MRQDLFTHTVNTLRYGQTQIELSEELHTAVQRAIDTGKNAEITLKIIIKPEANGKQVFITDKITSKIPQFAREQTILFPTADGNLQRDDPRQASVPRMRSVETEQPLQFKNA